MIIRNDKKVPNNSAVTAVPRKNAIINILSGLSPKIYGSCARWLSALDTQEYEQNSMENRAESRILPGFSACLRGSAHSIRPRTGHPPRHDGFTSAEPPLYSTTLTATPPPGVMILLVTVPMRKCLLQISYRSKTIVRYPKSHCFLTEALGNVRGVRDRLRLDLSDQHSSPDQHRDIL